MSVTDRLAALSPKQRRALFEKLQEKGLKAARTHQTAPPILRVPRDGDLPLSFSQQRLWLIDQIEPGSPAYNIPQVLRLVGEIEPRLLQWIFSEIVRRHESLRTTFVSRENGPVQVIASPEPLDLSLLDLSHLPEKERESQAQDLARAEVRRPFDLRRGPLLRLLLVRLAERNHLLLLTMHHIVADGWSIGILVREITALYMAFVEGRPSLPELPVQYADFAAWQVSWLQGEVLENEISFWRRQLAGLPPLLELPTDRPRPTVQTFRGATRPLHLGSDSSDAVRELCRREQATPFMALLAAWALLLGRHAGQDDVVVGAPVAGRNRLEVGGLIGFFVNTLVLRSDLSGNPSFSEFLRRVRQVSLAAFAHQDLPFERIVEEVGGERNLAISPLVQVLFVLQNAPRGSLTVPGLALSPVDVDAGIAKFDLSLSLADTEAGLSGTLEFATDLFDPTTVDRLRDHFQTLLASAMSDPQRRLAELPLLSIGELHQILWEWNDTAADSPEDRCLHEIFSLQARRTPGALALAAGEAGVADVADVADTERLTFATLDAAAERLAARLRILGVGPEVVVALYLERVVVLGVAVLAVLKAGGAFLPIDLANPRERLAWVLQDARPLVVLTVSGLAPRLPNGPLVICLDVPAEPEAGAPRSAPPPMPPMPPTSPDNLAYVIYTSGSTGRPKGTMIPHRGVVNYLSWAVRAYRVEEGCGAPVHTSLAFDLTLTSLLAPWLAGRCALLLPESEGAASLGLTLAGPPPAATGFSLVKLTPAHLQLLAEQPGAVAAGRTQALVVGGEALFGKSLEAWRSAAPVTRVFNEYGPTETVVGCCVYEAPAGVLGDGPVPIGRPIANSRLYLVDDQCRPVPLGTPGELLIGGVGLARGYLRRPGLSAQRFIPDALGEAPGGRLYRTGDRVRQRPDGILEYLGRLDDQVKIRGFRIELGEIEAALARLPGVREAVVLVREDETGDKRLAAYVANTANSANTASSTDPAPAPEDLRTALRRTLPEAMVPAEVVVLPSLPLNANGKVDRRALAKIAPVAVRPVARFLTPQGPVEEVLAQIWTEVLGGKRRVLARIGAQDDFFTLGGHSLLATQVMSRVRNAFGVELPLRALFEAPTVTALAARIDGERRGEHAQPSPIVPVPRDRDLPLSFAQQRLWFIDQLEPGSPLYNVPVALRVEGPLDPRVLERSLSEIVGRHETLRTTFAALEGAPIQVIHPRSPFVLPVVDLSGLPESRRAALARRLAEEEAGRPFDLARGLMLRALLVRLAEGDNVTALTMHHVASDGWSMGILVREVAALYAAFAAGRPSPLPELATQYADFSVWQHSWLRGELLDNEISYWRRQLAHLPPRLELPTDRPRPAVQSLRGAVRPVRLPAGLTRQAQALSRHEGATLFMLLLAGFQALLARTSGQQDVAVGSPVAGRNRVEIEGLIGFFVNTLVLRGNLSGNQRSEPSFRELLGRARETALAAYLHQDVPFEKLVEELAPERSLAQTPLFQVMLVLQNAPMGSLEVQDLRLHPLPVAGTTSKFDLTVTLTEDGGGLSGTAEHATDLFDSTTIDRLIGHFERLLAAAVEAPERRIAELPLLSEAERGQTVIEWNDTGPSEAPTVCDAGAQELFAAQALRTPDAVAVVFGDGQQTAVLTYAELAGRAGRLARHLRRLGVGPDVLVGLFVERSLDMVVGMLGILQAGGAYVPLDPGYPEQRLAFMLEDTRAPVVVTQEPLQGRVPAGGAEVVLLDGDWLDFPLSREGGGGWERGPGGEGLAYVIYTSGSTGRPKGVALSHGALRNLIDWHLATLLGGVRTLQIASVSFDASFHEMFACWGSGGTLVVVAEETRRDMQALASLLVEQQIEKAILPVVVLTQLAEVFAGRAELPPLREITTTGERLQTNRAMAALFERLPECAFHNHYGPSETHVATAFTLPSDPADWQVYPSIGRPIRRSSAHVLETGLEPGLVPAPVGVPGDLHLGGACVARGYLGRPGLTAERFVPDPFSSAPGGRLYRTGDTVRLAVNGELEYLGRFDDQVKIRGFRIELGEIEAALATHPAVREAIVVVRGEGAARRLVACVIPAEGIQELDGLLRAHLRDRLPDYMVPAAFVPVESFPLTPSGKVDRRALALSCPEPRPGPREVASAGAAAPLTPAEELLAGIWSEVLGVERVGIHESFFALGGHSLLATQVMSRIRGVFGTDLPVRQLFESPMIAELARAVEQAGSTVQAPPIFPVQRNRDLPASFAQQRLWLIDQIEPGNPAYNIPLALRLSGEIEPGLLARIFSEIVRRHEALRTTFASRDDGPVQVIAVIASVEPLELPLLDLSHLPAEEREAQARALALSEARRPFDLQRGPLLRLLLVRLAGTDWLLLLTLHHIVSDGWSLGVLVREVTALYEAYSQGLPSPLPELPVQYADFAAWQRSWLQGEALEAQLGYWRRRLAGAPAVLELPLDRPRPPVQSYRGAACPVVLSLPLSEAIGRLCRQQGVTPFMALLAGWAVLLERHAGQEDVLVGTPIAGRNRREIESLIGFFVNTLVLRADLSGKPSGNPSLAELLGQVRRTALDAFAHQDLPFERLVEELAPERTLAHTPLFQVQLVLQNAPMGDLVVPGLAISTLGVDSGVAKFDLSLSLSESPDGFAGVLAYAADLFDRSTAERLAARFQTLLSGMAAAGLQDACGAPLHDLEVLSETERRQLLVDWSAAEERVSALSLHGLVERQAERTPDAVAVIFEEERWSYRDLVRRSREIAASLRGQGVGPGDRVAILDQRSAERVARVLGVLASGATYVAIDSGQPEAWRARILADLAPVRVLGPLPLVALEDHAPAASEPSATGGDLPGYVVYTSGSTGRPKGIVAHHRGAATYLEWMIRNYGLTASDVALQLAPLTFDASLRDTLAPLAAGGRIVIVPEGVARDPAALLERMEAFGVTCLPSIVPSLLRLLVEEALASGRKVPSLPSLPSFQSLRLILASGEKLHGTDAAAVRKAFGDKVELINQYGPSEATMTSTWYPVTAADESLPALPVGRPAASARVFLLDRALRPVPPGAVGEICLGGPGLAFGYLGQPDRTAEVFIPDPFGVPGDRLYRTGDRGRYRPDGVLELLGRIDLQVKIRGQRVEPGEVETVLRSHPAVREAVVAAFGEDEPRLAAWLVADGSGADDLRAFLAERLPASMIPADWVFLDALPLTPHGKVDRARLPAPGRERKAVQAPRDPIELRLVRLWEEILGSRGVGSVGSVGISDNFFALGGHSLAAVRLMAGVRRLFGRELPLAELFRRPTIEALAELLRRGAPDFPWSPLVELAPGRAENAETAPLFCIHGADGHALTFGDLARTLSAAGEDRPVFALEARGLAEGQAPLQSIEEMAGLYLAAIREVRPRGPYRLLGYSMGSKIAFTMARELERAGETVEQLVLVDIPALPRTEAILVPEIPEEVRALPDFDAELANRQIAVWMANQEASRRWSPAPYQGKALLIVAEDGVCAGAADPALGWGAVAAGGVEVVFSPGDHFSLFRPPYVETLAERIRTGGTGM
ncbi:MAG TPA: amino acid adenylation domain-containing protein [Thermoanaerobaculia bacterium]|nr:amino acid adenylation domain-containing protein [Thermoanaerobaculia bacterium]